MPDSYTAGSGRAAIRPGRKPRPSRKPSELATLAEIGRVILQAELDQDALCELIYDPSGRSAAAGRRVPAGPPMVVNDTAGNPRVPEAWCARFGSRTILVVPLLVADEPIGALLADDVDATHLFSPRRIRILSGIANQVAIAIENARLQMQEAERARLGGGLELAQAIQRKLLPSAAPELLGYQIAYRWRSAREIGGDFFDFIPLAPARWGLVIADVSDKGIPAALYMMFARTLLRAVALSVREPAAALARVNALILADSTSDMFVTVYYSVLDVGDHGLTYASGGHNLAFYALAGDDRAEPMITGDIALGIIPDAEFEQQTLELAPGDVVPF